MPVEIKELQIRAAIGPRERPTPENAVPSGDLQGMKEEIIREVTEEVLKAIQLKLER